MNVKIWDKIKNDGIADGEVLSFVNELLDQRDTFSQRQEHLLSLTKLAEKTIIEADKLAEDIRREILDKAKADASRITAEAEERAQKVSAEAEERAQKVSAEAEARAQQVIAEAEERAQQVIAETEERAQHIIKEKETEIVALATEQAAAVRAEAEREAELLREQERQRVQGELRDRAQKLYVDLAVQLDVLKQQAAALEVEWEGKLSQPAQTSASAAAVEEEPLSSQIPATIQPEDNSTPSDSSEASPEPEASLEPGASLESEASIEPEAGMEPAGVLNEVREMFEDSKFGDGTVEEEAPKATDKQGSGTYAGGVELEIQQPISVRQIMEIKRYLQNWPEIGISELGPTTDGYSIVVFLNKPIQLIDVLKEFPGVSRIDEDTPNAGTTKANGRPRKNARPKKIKITLSENTDSV